MLRHQSRYVTHCESPLCVCVCVCLYAGGYLIARARSSVILRQCDQVEERMAQLFVDIVATHSSPDSGILLYLLKNQQIAELIWSYTTQVCAV